MGESADSQAGLAKDDYGADLKIACDGVEVVEEDPKVQTRSSQTLQAHDAVAQRRGSRFGTHSQASLLRDAILDR